MKTINGVVVLALLLTSCTSIDGGVAVEPRNQEPIPLGCQLFPGDDISVYDADLNGYNQGEYLGLATLDTNGDPVVYVDLKLLAKKAREIGVAEEDFSTFVNSTIYHEKCVHSMEYNEETLYLSTPIDIPNNFSAIGLQIVGTRGSYLVIRDSSGREYPMTGYKEMIAMYLMYNNEYVSPEFRDRYGPLLPQWNLYLIADALQKSGSVNFEEVLVLFHSSKYEDQMKAWELLTGKPFGWLNENGVPYVLAQAWALDQSFGITEKLIDPDYAKDYYYTNFQDISSGNSE